MEWNEKPVRRITETNLSLALYGGMIAAFSLGSMFSIQLVRYGYFIMIASTVVVAVYLKTSFMNWYKNVEIDYSTHLFGLAGVLLLLLFFGIQSSQVPFKVYLLIIGLILILPALINMGGKRT